MLVRYKPTGQLGQIPDDKYDPTLFEIAQEQTQPELQVRQNVPQPDIFDKIYYGAKSIGKELARPFMDTSRNIATAAITLPQAAQAAMISKINPALGAEMASQDIFGTQKRAEEIATDPNAIRKQIGSSAQIASWAVPYGKAGFVGSKFIVPGAVQGALTGAGRELTQEETTPEEVAKSGFKGAAIGAATGAAMQGLGWLYGKVANKLRGASPAVEKSINKVKMRSVSKDPLGEAEEVQSAITRNLGTGSAKAKLSKLPDAMNQMDDTIKTSLENKIIDKTKLIANYQDDLLKNSAYAAKDPKLLEATDQIAKRLESAGDDALKIYSLKSELSGELGNVFKKIMKGTPITPIEEAKLSMWGAIKNSLDDVNPAIRTLNTDQNLLIMAKSSLIKQAEQKGIGIPIPGTLSKVPVPISSGTVQGAKSLAGKALTSVGEAMTPTMPPIVGQAVPQSVVRGTEAVLNPPQSVLPDMNNGTQPQTNVPSTMPEITQKNYITGHSPEEIYQAILSAQSEGNTQAEGDLRQMYQDETAYQTQQAKTSPQALINPTAIAGLDSLVAYEKELGFDRGVFDKSKIIKAKTTPGAELYETYADGIVRSYLTAKVSRTPTKEQIKSAREVLLPNYWDSPTEAQAKLQNLKQVFEGYKYQKPTTDLLDLMPEISQ